MIELPIKVLLVEDSPVALSILQKILKSSSDIEVVGTATNGEKALELIPQLQPRVICTDLYMKKMDGLEFTKQVMSKHPRPILVISNAVAEQDSDNVFQLLQAGAIDVFPKPTTGLISDYEKIGTKLVNKLKLIAGVKVFTKRSMLISAPTLPSILVRETTSAKTEYQSTTRIKAIAIGASTGGPQALQKILALLPKNLFVPVFCTQHISPGFLKGLVDWLAVKCQLPLKIAVAGQYPNPGTVYFAPEGNHLELNSGGKFVCSDRSKVDGHCPSVTANFKSVAQYYGKHAVGILLTGMGRDGAAGMQAISQAGGTTIAQDEKTCIVFGMPKEAIALNAAQYVLPLPKIAPFLLDKVLKNS
ncbi:chemotaxis-specific protein-glutamate methyltransferase CheB [Myxosarcina sp. GI1]|uniref:chemotaxis-specific protein-glutamate methyltransferase CheB n=1 Tax=Myxosarcina sp. GI1 TaxID=1541065 RepID=UPI000566D43D|nr:chemotaxis-specific protein-glutamate methyltransferase CheB [Myxosarcina sp. GI1]